MAIRFSSTSVALNSAGTSFVHGLSASAGAQSTPTEWCFNNRNGSAAYASSIYLLGVNSSVIGIAMTSTSTGVVDVFCSIPHSIIS